MQQQILRTANHYLSNLPGDKKFYYSEDFENANFPQFLIQRIQLALFQELLQSVSAPHTEWANMQDETAVKKWNQFIDSLKSTVHVPSNQMDPLLKQAVTDIVHILVQPRQSIPELLFEEEDTLTCEQLEERVKWLVVYPHFAHVLERYMERKGKNELGRQQCESIITQIDKKITQHYTPFQWGDMLQPLFELVDSPVEADLFRLFFEDRKLDEKANMFADVDSGLDRDEFIDVLIKNQGQKSGAVEIQDQGINESDNTSSKFQHNSENEGDTFSLDKKEDNELTVPPIEIESSDNSQSVSDEPASNHTDEGEIESRQEFPDESFNHDAKKDEESEPSSEELEASDENAIEDQTDEQEGKSVSLNDIFNDSSESDDDLQNSYNKPSGDQANIFSGQNSQNDEVPIWQRFASTENEADNGRLNQKSEESKASDEWDEKDDLRKYLQSEQEYYIQSLFEGSKQTYLETLESIGEQESWKEAYQLVNQEVFQPNKINIYSEAAVDFTDRLQNYYQKMRG